MFGVLKTGGRPDIRKVGWLEIGVESRADGPADIAVGTAVAGSPADGVEVGCGVDVDACGVAVAEDPQAKSNATNKSTIALGRCLVNCDLDLGTGPLLHDVLRYSILRIRHYANLLRR